MLNLLKIIINKLMVEKIKVNKFMKKTKVYSIIFSLTIIFSIFLFNIENIDAISGACSSHGGVNCSMGRQLNGKVYCNDGWTDSMANYSFMVMCQNYKFRCNTSEWNDLSRKYKLEELYFKMGEITDEMNRLVYSPSIQKEEVDILIKRYNLYKSQYDLAFALAEESCFDIGADRAYRNNFERIQSEFYDKQIKESQKEIEQLEEDKRKLDEWYRKESERLDKLEKKNICPLNSTLVEDKCKCNIGYSVYSGQCVLTTDYCKLTYGNNSITKTTNDTTHCDCTQGYTLDLSKKSCIEIPVKINIPASKEDKKIEEQISKEIEKEIIFKEDKKIEEQISKEVIIREKDKEDTKIKEDKEELEIEESKKIEKSKKGFLSIALNNTRGLLSRSFNTTRKFFSKLSNWL